MCAPRATNNRFRSHSGSGCRAIHDEPDGRRKLERYAAGARGMIERGVGDVHVVVRAAATADPQIADLLADLSVSG